MIELTIEQIEVLEQLTQNTIPLNDSDIITNLADNGYVSHAARQWYINATGRTALAAYKAQRDLVLFVSEFEEWLGAEHSIAKRTDLDSPSAWGNGYCKGLSVTIDNYRACKERITQDVE